jgi:hypothetical protein
LHLIAESVDEGNGGVVRDHLQTLSVSVVSAYSMSRDAVSSAAFARPSRMRGKGRSVQERLAAGWRRQDADEVDGVGHDESPRNESGSVQTSMQSALTDPRRIVAAEMYRINNRRYIAVADAAGKIAVVDVDAQKDPLRVSRAGRSRRVSTIPALRRVGRRHRRGRRGPEYLGDHA